MSRFNKKSIQFALAIGIGALVTQGCTIVTKLSTDNAIQVEGPQTKEERKVEAFTHIQAGDSFEVEVTLGQSPSLTIDAPKDLLPHLKATVQDGVLDLSSDTSYSMQGNSHVKVYVTVQNLDGIAASGSSSILIKGTVKADSFDARSSGASNITFSAEVGSLALDASGSSTADIGSLKAKSSKITASGASHVNLSGSADEANIDSSGSSEVSGKFSVDRAEVQTSGAAHAELSVTHSLKAGASGSSSIEYGGSVDDVEKETSGVGSIQKK